MRIAILYLLFYVCAAHLAPYNAPKPQEGDVCSFSPATTAPYKLSVCTMIYNEARYIEEWLAYHLLLKVDHFYIYNDGSSDNITEVLEPYIKLGMPNVIRFSVSFAT